MTRPSPVAETLSTRNTGEMEPVLHHIANKEPYEIFMSYRATFNRWSNRVGIHLLVIDVLCRGMCAVCYLVVGRWKNTAWGGRNSLGNNPFLLVQFIRCVTWLLYTISFNTCRLKCQKARVYGSMTWCSFFYSSFLSLHSFKNSKIDPYLYTMH